MGWTSRLTTVLERIGADEHDLERAARRVVVAVLALLRIVTVPTAATLALLSPDPPSALAFAIVLVIGVVDVAATIRWQWRTALRPPTAITAAPFLIDLVLVAAAVAISGASSSAVRLVGMPLPLSFAFLCSPSEVAGLGVAAVVLYAGACGLGDATATWAIEMAWATAVGAVTARQRARILRRMARTDRVRHELLERRPEAARVERRRVAAELARIARGPLAAIREAAASGPRPGLAAELGATTARVRGVVVELHALSASPLGLRGAVEQLASRWAPAATLDVVIEPVGAPATDALLLALSRDALPLVAGPDTRTLAFRAGRDPEGVVTLDLEADPPVRRAANAELPRAALRERAAHAGGRMGGIPGRPGSIRVTIADPTAHRPGERGLPGRALAGARLTSVVARAGGVLALGGVALVVGGTDAGFALAYLAALASSAGQATVLLVRRRVPRWIVFGVLLADLATLAWSYATAGDAQVAVLPLAVTVPASTALLLGPVPTVGVGAGTAAVVALFGGGSAAAYVALGWGTAVALMLTALITTALSSLRRVGLRRRELLRRTLAAEEEERRRLAGGLHDEALQLLLVARQDLEEAEDGAAGAHVRALEEIDAALLSLERTVADLDVPMAALPDDLVTALDEAARGALRRSAARVQVRVGPGVDRDHHGLLLRLTTELATNVDKHAGAHRVEVDAHAADDGGVVLDVRDDGVGFDHALVASAVGRGHVGLAAARDRVLRLGGTLELLDLPEGGAGVRVRLPPSAAPPDAPLPPPPDR